MDKVFEWPQLIAPIWRAALAGNTEAILALVFALSALAGIYSILFQLRIARWPTTEGEILSLGITTFGAHSTSPNETDWRARGLYRYWVNGREYQGHRLSTWQVVASGAGTLALQAQLQRLRAKASHRVSYNPKQPEKSYLQAPGWISLLITAAYTSTMFWVAIQAAHVFLVQPL